MSDVAVLINTWDGYKDAWPIMYHGLDKHWPFCPWQIYWMSNYEAFAVAPEGMQIYCYDRTSWTEMMRTALGRLIDNGYEHFLFLHEDYWLVEPVENDLLLRYAREMDEYNWDHIQLVPSWDVMTRGMQCGEDTSLFWVAKHSDYRTSNQASLWRTEAYLELLKDGESAWQFEVNGSKRARDMKCLCVDQDADWPIKYVYRHLPGWDIEPIVKGVFSHAAVRYCEREGLPYNFKAGEKVVKGG